MSIGIILSAAEQTDDPDLFEIARLHGICPNDSMERNIIRPYESAAAAITASALHDLADQVSVPLRRKLYRDYATKIMYSLRGPDFLANADPEWEGVLKHGSYHERKGLGVDESVMWGDHFFLEAAA